MLPNFIRTFFAIDLPQTQKELVGGIIAQLQKEYKQNTVRWVKSQNLHITLQFLALVNIHDQDKLIHNVANELKTVRAFCLKLDPLETFPTPYRHNIISLGMTPEEPVKKLAEAIGRGIGLADYPVLQRPFRAHLTLGRLDSAHPQALPLLALPPIALPVKKITWFQSEKKLTGSQYTALASFHLNPP